MWQTLNGFTSLWEGKGASNQPCKCSNASPDCCGQELWVLVALWERACFVTTGTFLEYVCPAVHCPGRHAKVRSALVPMFHGEGRNWTLHLGHRAVQGCWLLSGIQALTVRRCFAVALVNMLAVEVVDVQIELWERRDGGRWERGGFSTLMILYPATSTHNHSVSACSGD